MKETSCTPEKKIKLPSMKKIAETMGYPDYEDWKGRCYQISSWIVDHDFVQGRAVYGHYLGDVAPNSYFSERYESSVPFIRHGWILTPNNKIVDPTLWVFENVKPYLYYGDGVFTTQKYGKICVYDEGGNLFRQRNMKPVPPDDIRQKRVLCSPMDLKVRVFISGLLGEKPPYPIDLAFGRVFWLANCPVPMLQPYAKEIYTWLEGMGHKVLVPMDNWNLVMKGK